MCGIYTEVFKRGEEINLPKCLDILDGLKKRGPDWSFYKSVKNIFLDRLYCQCLELKRKIFLIMFLGQVNILYCLTEKFIIINF